MPKFKYALSNGKTLTLEGDEQPTDAEVEQHAKDAGVELQLAKPSTPAETLAALQEANKKPLPPTPTLSDEFTPAKVGQRALAGAKGEAEGFAGGLAAPVLALGYAIRHPVDAVEGAGTAALGLGLAGYHAITHPSETYDKAKTAALQLGMNPEAIGAVAGGADAMIASPAILKGLKGTRVGKAVVAGVSDAANRIPGVSAARAAYAPPAPPKVPKVKVPAPPLPLTEQLGVSPTATGAVMDSLPDTPVPAPARAALPLAHSSARTAAASDAARTAADSLGVASDVSQPGIPLGSRVGRPGLEDSLQPGVREPIPVPVRLRDSPPVKTVSNFEDIARELGLDPGQMQSMASHEPGITNTRVEPALASAASTGAGRAARISESNVGSNQLDELLTATHGPDVDLPANGGGVPVDLKAELEAKGLSPAEVQQELMKQLMASQSFREAGSGTRKRGSLFSKPKD